MNTQSNVIDTIEYHSNGRTYRAYFEQDVETPSLALVQAISAIKGIDPTRLDPLGNIVDLEALDTILQSQNRDNILVTLELHGYEITIQGSGIIELKSIDPSTGIS